MSEHVWTCKMYSRVVDKHPLFAWWFALSNLTPWRRFAAGSALSHALVQLWLHKQAQLSQDRGMGMVPRLRQPMQWSGLAVTRNFQAAARWTYPLCTAEDGSCKRIASIDPLAFRLFKCIVESTVSVLAMRIRRNARNRHLHHL
jgi:hypothetical protein